MLFTVEIFTEMDMNRKQRERECEWALFSGEKGLRVGGRHVNSVQSCCHVIYSPCENTTLLRVQGSVIICAYLMFSQHVVFSVCFSAWVQIWETKWKSPWKQNWLFCSVYWKLFVCAHYFFSKCMCPCNLSS